VGDRTKEEEEKEKVCYKKGDKKRDT